MGYSVKTALPRPLQRIVRTALPLQWILSQDCLTKTITVDTQTGLPYQDHYSEYAVRIALQRPLQWILSQDCPTKNISVGTQSEMPYQVHFSGYSVKIALPRPFTVDTQSGLPYQDYYRGYSVRIALPRPLHGYSVRIVLSRPFILSQDCPTKTFTVDNQSGFPYHDHNSGYSGKIALWRPLQWLLGQDCHTKTVKVDNQSGLPFQDHYSDIHKMGFNKNNSVPN